jgi:hypothetical protein
MADKPRDYKIKKTVAKPAAKAKTGAKPKKSDSNQEGYMAPGSTLERTGSGNGSYGYSVGKGAGQKYSGMDDLKSLGKKSSDSSFMYLKTGINPKAMKATAGNPKPTKAQMEAAKKKNASKAKGKLMETQAQKKKNTKPAKGSTKGSTIGSKPSPKPTTGVYKRGNP